MGSAECARRTGLTVRALRVYERHGLIEPKRTGNGWRCYGPRELRQLNVVVTLKAFGMTLTQIRALLKTERPSLARVLQIQLRACSAKRDAMEKALELIRAALATIGSGKSLSVEELCNLTRSMEMGTERDTGRSFATLRALINEKLTPQEERAHMTWLSSRPSEELKALQEFGPAMQAALRSLRALQEKKVDPAAPEAQALIVQLKDLGGRYGLLKMQNARFEWNPSIGQKVWEVQARSYWVGMTDDFAAYLRAANAAAPWSKALTQLADEATKLVEQKVERTSAPAQALAKRLTLICSDHSLGDALSYARWAPYRPFTRSADENQNAALTSVWSFLASALEAAAPGVRADGMAMKNPTTVARELMNAGLSPDEERAAMNWIAARPPEELEATARGFLAPAHAVFRSLQDLRENKVDPAAPEAQSLIDEWNQILVRCQVRNRRAAMLEWNPSIASKWAEISARALLRGISSEEETTPDRGLWAYFRAAQAAAPWHQALAHVAEEAAKLMDENVDPAAARAQALAKRLALTCSNHSLGDALLYAHSAPVMQFLGLSEIDARETGTWAYLARALERRAAAQLHH